MPTPILGGPQLTTEEIAQMLGRRCPGMKQNIVSLVASSYEAYGALSGIGSLFPLAQALKETSWFTSPRWKQSFNPAGIGATNDGAWGGTFPSPVHGIIAQYGHLLAYALPDNRMDAYQFRLSRFSTRLEKLAEKNWRGIAINWEELTQRWAYSPELDPKDKRYDAKKAGDVQSHYGPSIVRIGHELF